MRLLPTEGLLNGCEVRCAVPGLEPRRSPGVRGTCSPKARRTHVSGLREVGPYRGWSDDRKTFGVTKLQQLEKIAKL